MPPVQVFVLSCRIYICSLVSKVRVCSSIVIVVRYNWLTIIFNVKDFAKENSLWGGWIDEAYNQLGW